MRNYSLIFINGRKHVVKGRDAFLTLSEFLRKTLKLAGTKIVCSEGDCGSCSVLCGKNSGENNGQEEPIRYQAIDSCIRFVFQLDCCHIITVEGLAEEPDGKKLTKEPCADQLSNLQKSMVDCHGSQCGFCTPGFVVAMTAVLEQNPDPSIEDWRHELTGNLCRCTGYAPIIDAAMQASTLPSPSLNQRYPVTKMAEAVRLVQEDTIQIQAQDFENVMQTVACPRTIEEAVEFLAEHPDAKIVAGGTDVGVQFNKGSQQPQFWLDLNRVESLTKLSVTDQAIQAGACTTWTDLENTVETVAPEFHKIISVFGSPQVRHVGTIGGNIINASPIADSLPLYFVCDAELELTSKSGTRVVNINDFYLGYKQLDLHPGELLTGVNIPLPGHDTDLRLYKVSRRRDMDISTFTAAICIERSGDTIAEARIAYGAVGPVVLRLKQTETFLQGRTFDLETMQAAGEIAVKEITPISDVRGGQDFRLQLAKNVLVKFYHEMMTEGAIA
ncbi:Nicotinate dehydrogenase FAD-subunit [Rubripirellula obstinata]|uniref:Nicotinate dehydrogenase FAD-subunit n=1 Tax=Rubripirellula obstinata TaxID=406547 RepID=A0A5B1CEF4_9BACT|nr:FAD binding domain-containing protein [Rubripirellula obstinata]KAA1259528.1 Nicotinate dehydrogenase FAD-subunit [Rubripirellula obstinata]